MSRIEDLLREATRESGASVEPGSLPGLDLSQVRYNGRMRGFRVSTGAGRTLVRRGFALPGLAAAMVVVVMALSLTLPGVLRGHSADGSGTAAAGQGLSPSGVPRYYVTGSGPQSARDPVSAEVVDSRTGAVMAVVKPPAAGASFVHFGSGSSDDRTFAVAAAQQSADKPGGLMGPLTFFLLRFDPATRQAALQQLPPLNERPGGAGNVASMAVSPDGTRLAVSAVGPEFAVRSDPGAQTFQVSVISLSPGGTWRTWKTTFSGDSPNPSPFILATEPEYDSGAVTALSWTPGSRVLALGIPPEAVMLDTTKAAGDLLRASRLVVLATRVPVGTAKGNAFGCDTAPSLSGDGTALVCFGQLDNASNPDSGVPLVVQGIASANAPVTLANAIGRFSAATGKLLSLTVLPGPYKAPRWGRPGFGGVAWSSTSGDVVITTQPGGRPAYPSGNGKQQVTTQPSGQPAYRPGNVSDVNGKQRITIVAVSHGVATAIPGPRWAAALPGFPLSFLDIGW
jgi:hypothetical protein